MSAPETTVPAPTATTGTSVVLCRGCCCGSATKNPRVDHAAQRERLARFVGERAGVRLLVTDCLGPCAQANVVVVRPSAAGRSAGGRPVWFGLVDEVAVDLLQDWIDAGGPGCAPLPALLDLHQIPRPRGAVPASVGD